MRLEDGSPRSSDGAGRSLYSNNLATYTRERHVRYAAARGFIELFGLPLRTQTRVQGALDDSAHSTSSAHATAWRRLTAGARRARTEGLAAG